MVEPDRIIRSERKTLAVSIDAFGVVTVRAPKSCSSARIFDFLREKEGWILKKKAERAGAGMRLPPDNLDGYTFLLLGKTCQVAVADVSRVAYDAQNARLYLPYARAREKLVKWLKDNAKRIFTQSVNEWSQVMGVHPSSVSVSSARTRWGSCSGKNALRFSFRLLYAPKPAVEYVVVHELAHCKYKNHSPAFWAEVARYYPEYKKWRGWLKSNALLMKIF